MSQARPDPSQTPDVEPVSSHAPAATKDTSELETFLPEEAALARPEPLVVPITGLRTARVTMVDRDGAEVLFAGDATPRRVEIASDVDREVVQEAFESGDRVLCEPDARGQPIIVGVVRARKPDTVRISARKIEIEGEEEVLVRSGKGAFRLREDGDVELVGSRISAASRGLFRLVGRMLRLN
jgi:hypothetical protein